MADELDALGGGIGPLVELAGQVLHREGHALGLGQLGVGVVHRRLAEHRGGALLKQRLVDALDVVPVQQPQPRQARYPQQTHQLLLQPLGFHIEAGFLFNVDTIYHWEIPLSYTLCYPIAYARFAFSSYNLSVTAAPCQLP